MAFDVGAVDGDGFAGFVVGVEADVFQQALHDRLQAASADVFHRLVHFVGDPGDGVDAVVGEVERHLFGRQQFAVLADEGVGGFREDAAEVFLRQTLEFHADGQAALKLGQQV